MIPRPAHHFREFRAFLGQAVRLHAPRQRLYWPWMALLTVLIGVGVFGYVTAVPGGLIAPHMRDQVSWGFYIGNFTFLVGVAAAAVLLVIPAYVYTGSRSRRS